MRAKSGGSGLKVRRYRRQRQRCRLKGLKLFESCSRLIRFKLESSEFMNSQENHECIAASPTVISNSNRRKPLKFA
jgi:hypothetical protein